MPLYHSGGKFIIGIHPLIKTLIMFVLHLILIKKCAPVVNILEVVETLTRKAIYPRHLSHFYAIYDWVSFF
jgi:hypothetical protein